MLAVTIAHATMPEERASHHHVFEFNSAINMTLPPVRRPRGRSTIVEHEPTRRIAPRRGLRPELRSGDEARLRYGFGVRRVGRGR